MSNICSNTNLRSNDLQSLQKEFNFIRRQVCIALGSGGGGGAVNSVFGRAGTVTAQSGDYDFNDIGNTPTTLAGYGIVDAWFVTGSTNLTGSTIISSSTFPLTFQSSNGSAVNFSDGGIDINITNTGDFFIGDDGGPQIVLFDNRTGIDQKGLEYGSDYSANYTDRSLIDKGYGDATYAAIGGSGANTALSNLASVAINIGLLPATDDNIALGSVAKKYNGLYLADTRTINWGNGGAILDYTISSGSFHMSIDGSGGDSYFQIYKAGRNSYIQLINGAVNDGLTLAATGSFGVPVLKTVASTAISIIPAASEKLYIGAITGSSAKVNFCPSTTAMAALRLDVGVAPTSPVDGDIWREDNTNTGLKIRVNGVTKTIVLI